MPETTDRQDTVPANAPHPAAPNPAAAPPEPDKTDDRPDNTAEPAPDDIAGADIKADATTRRVKGRATSGARRKTTPRSTTPTTDSATPDVAPTGRTDEAADAPAATSSAEVDDTAATDMPDQPDAPRATDGTEVAQAVQARVWEALRAHPGATVAELATDARLTRSKISPLIAEWATEGSVTPTPGPTARAARRWTIAPTPLPEVTVAGPGTRSDAEVETPPEAAAVTDAAVSVAAGPEAASPTPTRTAHRPSPSTNRSGSVRLAAGALRGLVEEYLTDHPGDHGPVEIGKAIRRSSGAVANALERLVTSGWAVRTSDRPRRYRYTNPDATTSAPETEGADSIPLDAEEPNVVTGAVDRQERPEHCSAATTS